MQVIDYLIIGGGLAGGYAAETVRSNDPSGSVTIITSENHRPYDRVPLSKNYLLGKMKRDVLYIKKAEFYQEKKIEILIGHKVASIDTLKRAIRLDDGQEFGFKKLLLATGGQARRLSIPGSELNGVFYLRTVDEAEAIQKTLERSKNAVIIGGGFIGCELASTFTKKGIKSTIIEVGPRILGRVFDEDTAMWLASFLESKGVKILTKTIPSRLAGNNGTVQYVETETGNKIPTDFVCVGIGILPNVELAKNSGLSTDNGIVVNEYLETSVSGIYAAGDVARFYSPVFGRHLRLEHYDLTIKHGKIAGENMSGSVKPFDDLPYFFSFIFELRIEVYCDMSKYDKIVVRGRTDGKEGFVKFYADGGVVNAVMLVNKKEDVAVIKDLILSRKKFDDLSILGNESIKLNELVLVKKS